MSVYVINRLTFSVPISQVVPDVRAYFPAGFDACEGFERFAFVQTADDEGFALIQWDTAEHAQAGAAKIGPTLFNDYLTPHLIEQDRRVGPALVLHADP